MATACGTVLGTTAGCGDNGKPGNTPPDAGGGVIDSAVDSANPPPIDAAPDGPPIDMGPTLCTVVWQDVQSGTNLDDQIWGLTSDSNNNVFVAGYERGVTGVTNIEPTGNSSGVVIKLSPAGAVQWKATLDTGASDTVEDVTVDPETGRLYAVGRTSGAFSGFSNKGQFDTFLASLEPTGQVAKVFQTGDERPQHPARINLAPNRKIAIAGFDDMYVEGSAVIARDAGFIAGFERSAPPNESFQQNYVQKIPLSAQIVNHLTGVAVDKDGSGSMYTTRFVTGGATVGTYVEKRNSDGSVVWSKRIAAASATMANAVAMSPTNDLFVAGAASVMLGSMSFGQQDAFVAKVDKATGNFIWVTQAGGTGSDYPTALAFDDAGNVYIAGETDGSLAQGGTNAGGFDAFAMKFAPDGTLTSTWQKGSTEFDFVTSLTVDHCGNVLIGGHSKGVLVDGRTSTAGGYDMFVLRGAL